MSQKGREIKRTMREVEELTEKVQRIHLPELDEQAKDEVALATAETTGGNGKGEQPVNEIDHQANGAEKLKERFASDGFLRLKEEQHSVAAKLIWQGFGLTYPGYRRIDDMLADLFQGYVEIFLVRGEGENPVYMVIDRINEYRRRARVQYFSAQGVPTNAAPSAAAAVMRNLSWLNYLENYNAEDDFPAGAENVTG